MPEEYAVGFEKILNKEYLKNVGQLQQSTSNVYGFYCAYYVINQHAVKTMMDILKYFHPNPKRNDHLLVSKMRRVPKTLKRLSGEKSRVRPIRDDSLPTPRSRT